MNSEERNSSINEKWFTLVPKSDQEHLLSSLNSLRRSQPTTPYFKLYGKSDWSVVEDFLKSLDVTRLDVPNWLLEYEQSRKEKYGAQGGHAPWDDLRDNAHMYFERESECHLQPTSTCLSKYKSLSLQELSSIAALNQMKNDGKVEDRANGWRLFGLKKTDERAQRDALYLIKSGLWKESWAYFFSTIRKKKLRLFVPMPFCVNIMQGKWFNPFLQAIQKDLRANKHKSEFIFWGDKIGFKSLCDDIMTPIISKCPNPSKLIYVVRDFDKMDTSTGVNQKKASFLPKLALAFSYAENSSSYHRMSEAMLFSNTLPIATPDGMWEGNHGEASGATVTNGGETCCNEDYNDLFQLELTKLCEASNITFLHICSFGNGDDGLSVYHLDDLEQLSQFSENVRKAAEYASEQSGFVIQSSKWDILQGWGKYCQFLPYWDEKANKMKLPYPAALILNAICNPFKQYKKSEWDKDYRDLDIIEKLDNGYDLPYFTQLIDYVDNGMKYRLLGRSEEETRRILSKYESYKRLQDGSRQYNIVSFDVDDDISKSPTVQYLLAKRNWKLN